MADAALLMGDDELAISFRGAKDPKAQVTVLADLNVCSPRKVADRLEALGLFEGTELRAEQFVEHKRRRGSGKTGRVNQYPADRPSPGTPAIDELRAMELFREGLDDLAMAETLGCPVGRVVTWRKRMHLMRPRGGNMSAKKEKAVENPKTKAEQIANPECAEPVEQEAEPMPTMSVSEFITVCSQLLTPPAMSAPLYINGAPVHSVSAIHIRCAAGGAPVVDILTEGDGRG